jgi:hypothetical protein
MYGLLSEPISRIFFNLAVDGSSFLLALKHLDPFNQCLVPIVRQKLSFQNK